jgi:trimeric autotransporter adhesin
MRKCLVFFAVCVYGFISEAQNVGIGVPVPQNKLHVGGGFRLDTLTGVGGAGLVLHDANGVVYGIKFTGNTNDVLRGDGSFGTYTVDGNIGWLLNGNSGTNPTTHFLGTIDNQPLVFKVNNIRHGYLDRSIFFGSGAGEMNTSSNANIALGSGALGKNILANGIIAIGDSSSYNTNYGSSSGVENTAVGYRTLFANTTGNSNTAFGGRALTSNTTGFNNTAIGINALKANTNGAFNTAVGNVMHANTTGYGNTAVGGHTLLLNTTGNYNTAVGLSALLYNTTGQYNTAIGVSAGAVNVTGTGNTAIGFQALALNQVSDNTAVGHNAMSSNSVGLNNNAFGAYSLEKNISGGANSAFGHEALRNTTGYHNSAFGNSALKAAQFASGNTAFGSYALTNNVTGSNNTVVGYVAGFGLPTNVSNVTCIGAATGWITTVSNHVNIGNFSVQWIGGQTGWFHYSDKRIKNNIKDDVPGLAFITKLKPITYNVDIDKQEEIANSGKNETNSELIKPTQKDWEGKYDVEKIKMTGFFAQNVEEAAQSINYSFNGVYNPKNGGLLSLDYSAFVVPLVKAVQEQQTIIENQQKQIGDLIKRIEALEKK